MEFQTAVSVSREFRIRLGFQNICHPRFRLRPATPHLPIHRALSMGYGVPIPVAPQGPRKSKTEGYRCRRGTRDQGARCISLPCGWMLWRFQGASSGFTVAKAMAGQIANPHGRAGTRLRSGPRFFFIWAMWFTRMKTRLIWKAKTSRPCTTRNFTPSTRTMAARFLRLGEIMTAKPPCTAKKSAILHFLQNFCDSKRRRSPDNQTANSNRLTMIQPYPYWLFETAVCYLSVCIPMTLTEANWMIRWGRKIPNIDGWSKP